MADAKYLCLQCGGTFPEGEYTACPGCGDHKGIPADLGDALDLHITRHELRVLVMWAEFWANAHKETSPKMLKTVYGIADRLNLQDPKHGALTFSQDLADVRESFGNANVQSTFDGTLPPPERPKDH